MYNRKDYPSSEYTFINPMSKDMRTTRAIQKGLIDPSKPFAQPVRNKDLGIPSPYMPSPAPLTKEQIEKRFGKERAENLEKMFKKFKGKI